MNELVYARSPARGEVELVIAKNHQASVYPLDGHAILSLYEALSKAVWERLVDSLPQTRKADPRRLDGHETTEGLPARQMGDVAREGLMLACPFGCGVPLKTIDLHGSIVTQCC